MKLFKKEEVDKKRKDQSRDLTLENERKIASLKKILKLQNEIDFDGSKAKKMKDYQTWCDDLQKKMSTELGNLKAYQKLIEERKEEFYDWIAREDEIKDRIITLKEEVGKLEIQLKWKQEVASKQNAIIPSA